MTDQKSEHLRRGNVLLQLGRNDEAFLQFVKAWKADLNDFHVFGLAINSLLRAGRLDHAENILQSISEVTEGNCDLVYLKGLVNLHGGRNEAAVLAFQRAVALAPNDDARIYFKVFERLAAKDIIGCLAELEDLSKIPKAQSWTRQMQLVLRMELRSWNVSVAEVDHLLAEYSPTHDMFYLRAVLKWKEGDLDGALKDFSSAIELRPDDASTYLDRAQLNFENRRYLAAIPDLDKAEALGGDPLRVFDLRSECRYLSRDRAGAIKDLSRGLQTLPESLELLYKCGRMYLESFDTIDRADACFNSIIQLDSSSAMGYAGMGLASARRGNYPEAEQHLLKAVDLDPSLPDPLLPLAELMELHGRVIDAEKYLLRIIELAPGSAMAHYAKAGIHMLHKENSAAMEELSMALELDESFFLARLAKGALLLELNPEEAVRELLRVIQQQGENQLGYILVILAGLSEHISIDILKYANKLIDLDPESPFPHFLRGIMLIELEDHHGARRDMTKAIELKKDFGIAYAYRGYARAHLGEFGAAEKDFKEALGRNGSDPDVYCLRGWVYLIHDRLESATEDLKKAVELQPDDGMINYVCGLLAIKQGRKQKAQSHFSIALARGLKKATGQLKVLSLEVNEANSHEEMIRTQSYAEKLRHRASIYIDAMTTLGKGEPKQEELASATGISQPTWSKLLRNSEFVETLQRELDNRSNLVDSAKERLKQLHEDLDTKKYDNKSKHDPTSDRESQGPDLVERMSIVDPEEALVKSIDQDLISTMTDEELREEIRSFGGVKDEKALENLSRQQLEDLYEVRNREDT